MRLRHMENLGKSMSKVIDLLKGDFAVSGGRANPPMLDRISDYYGTLTQSIK